MKIKILDRFTPSGKIFYEWSLADGPDGIEEVRGYAVDLITAFSKVLEYMRMLIMYGPLTLLFAEDKEFMPWFKEVMIPRFDAQLKARALAQASRTG